MLSPLPLSSHGKPVDSFGPAPALEHDLKRAVRGEVRFDRGSRALYATDGSNYRQIPIGLVVPRDADDVVAAVAACRAHGAPVLPRGAGTSLAGQCCNVAVVLDFTKYMHEILEIDPERRVARIQPGVVLDTLRSRAEAFHLTFGPDPSTHSRCTLGGMMGNNSCGTHSLLAGKTVDNVEELRILLYDGTEMTVGATDPAELDRIIREGGRRGEIYRRLKALRDRYADQIRARFPQIPRRVSGYNLDELLPERGFNVARALVGTEGTCAVVLDAKVKLIHSPQHRALVGVGYSDAFAAADDVPGILEFKPIGLEGFEGTIVDGLRRKGAPNLELLPEGRGFLLVEFGFDDPDQAQQAARRFLDYLTRLPHAPNARLYTASEARAVWKIRETGARSAAAAPGAPHEWEGWDDAAVAPEKLGRYLRDIRQLLNEYNYRASFYGHFGHGCIHMRVTFDLETAPGIRKYGEFVERAADLVVSYGGSLSGEHGDGQSRGALLPKMFGNELMEAFREFKAIWDPGNRMNPHKVVNAYLPTENLRLGADYAPMKAKTYFAFPDDGGSFAHAALRCVGLGECRKQDSGAMCPSFMVTLEEEHSTRGRAHMLFELLQGEVVRGGWSDDHVKKALDLCLSCKACKSECPTNVDIATYRAEFLAHYYESRARPLHAYAFGMVNRWLDAASFAPRVANLFMHLPGLSGLVRSVLQIAPQRTLPKLAPVSFRSWARGEGIRTVGNGAPVPQTDSSDRERPPSVLLWVDTFNNHIHPDTIRAAVQVLRAAGCDVAIPAARLCCGRPLYDFGLLDHAKAYLQTVLHELSGPIDAGTPIVVLEPSCASVFREELCNLLPADPRAQRLRNQTYLLADFLESRTPAYQPPPLPRKVLLHGHCHHRAVLKLGAEEALLRQMGADVQALDAGCCGMAGAFGFGAETYDVAMAVGERILLPAVRKAANDTLIVSDGFSCREQILQSTGRRGTHIAEAIADAMDR